MLYKILLIIFLFCVECQGSEFSYDKSAIREFSKSMAAREQKKKDFVRKIPNFVVRAGADLWKEFCNVPLKSAGGLGLGYSDFACYYVDSMSKSASYRSNKLRKIYENRYNYVQNQKNSDNGMIQSSRKERDKIREVFWQQHYERLNNIYNNTQHVEQVYQSNTHDNTDNTNKIEHDESNDVNTTVSPPKVTTWAVHPERLFPTNGGGSLEQ